MTSESEDKRPRQRGGELGRLAGKFVKNAGPNAKHIVDEGKPRVEKAVQDWRPHIEKAVEDFKPKAEKAGRDAGQYAQGHQDELKSLAMKGVRMRLGPLGMALDARGVDGANEHPAGKCTSCQAQNPPSANSAASAAPR